MADSSVRPARPGDAVAIARVQAAAWAQVWARVLPAEVLGAVGSEEAVATWSEAVGAPPSPRHRVLLALAGEEIVGFAAIAPATDPDLDPVRDAELHALCVAPERGGAGHGSRLVNACADVMRGLDVAHLCMWLSGPEERLRRFLEQSGWADDGARRGLDLRGDGAVVVEQVRLSTALTDAG